MAFQKSGPDIEWPTVAASQVISLIEDTAGTQHPINAEYIDGYSWDDIINILNGKYETWVVANNTTSFGLSTPPTPGTTSITQVTTTDNVNHIADMKVGDVILVVAEDVPDYWVSSITGTEGSVTAIKIQKLETVHTALVTDPQHKHTGSVAGTSKTYANGTVVAATATDTNKFLTAVSVSHSGGTISVDAHSHTFTGTAATIKPTVADHTYTPEGSVSASMPATFTGKSASVFAAANKVLSGGTVGGVLPKLSYTRPTASFTPSYVASGATIGTTKASGTVANSGFSGGTFVASVESGVYKTTFTPATLGTFTFTGTSVNVAAKASTLLSGGSVTLTGGGVSYDSTWSTATISATFTPSYASTSAVIGTTTASGTITLPTFIFEGSEATLTHSVTGASYTPAGTISETSITGSVSLDSPTVTPTYGKLGTSTLYALSAATNTLTISSAATGITVTING
jgi:hypothetical protein